MTLQIDVIIPSYNCLEWIDRTIDSVMIQTLQPRRVILIDDASEGPDSVVYAKKCAGRCAANGWMMLRNASNAKCPKNLFTAIQLLETPPEGVIFLLDGDDFLPHDRVFARLDEVYADPAVWMTYGSYVPHPTNTGQVMASAYSQDVIWARTFRQHPEGRFNHPITFKRHLWNHITPADAQDDQGNWIWTGYDLVIMMPLLELTSRGHFRFLDETLYVYNSANPDSESLIFKEGIEHSRIVLRRPPKDAL